MTYQSVQELEALPLFLFVLLRMPCVPICQYPAHTEDCRIRSRRNPMTALNHRFAEYNIFCTKESYKGKYLHTSEQHGKLLFWHNPNDTIITVQPEEYDYTAYTCGGKVIGEFVCDYILSHCEMANADLAEQQSCVRREDIYRYSGGKEVFGWHISDLVIYDKPKQLSEFNINRAPQSWCYVQED